MLAHPRVLAYTRMNALFIDAVMAVVNNMASESSLAVAPLPPHHPTILNQLLAAGTINVTDQMTRFIITIILSIHINCVQSYLLILLETSQQSHHSFH